ncbi:FtsH protease activity modulator HflK [Gammaproteobacteria bacterium]|jgi:modulator of FtsH protease HflK|nr:FtsH protease activity modulator HflK [Gammaproteobacteria bacterium]MDG2237110.1 FtsH protease activity modulator HflK [Arenicellales bacterium]
MPWNQPGSDNRDPWGQGNGQKGPPDLDEVIRDLQKKLSNLFGGRGSGRRSGGGKGPSLSAKSIAPILVILAGLWLATGFYVVEQGEQGVELQLGAYKTIKEAGLRWHLPYPIESVEIVNVQQIRTVEVGYRTNSRSNQLAGVPREALMLTADENIIDIHFAVQYDIKDPRDLLFNVAESPDLVVRGATESAVREIVGRNSMDFAITGGRAEIAQETKILLQRILDRYDTGVNIKAVEMQNAQPPAEVKAAFDDAVKAREDEERLKNEAQAYQNDIIPRARGGAARLIQEAAAYRATVVAAARGEASRFLQVLDEYSKAPEVTRDRLYLDALEQVYANSTKLVIDQRDGGNNVMYLPLDQLIRQRGEGRSNENSNMSSLASTFGSGATTGNDSSRQERSSRLRSLTQ